MPEVQRVFFDIFALEYYEEEKARLTKEEIEKRKFESEHKSDAPVGFDTYQELIRQARDNTGSDDPEKDKEEET